MSVLGSTTVSRLPMLPRYMTTGSPQPSSSPYFGSESPSSKDSPSLDELVCTLDTPADVDAPPSVAAAPVQRSSSSYFSYFSYFPAPHIERTEREGYTEIVYHYTLGIAKEPRVTLKPGGLYTCCPQSLPARAAGQKMTVVLDLDETLITSRSGRMTLNPYLDKLFDQLMELNAEVVFWTAAPKEHAERVVQALKCSGIPIERVIAHVVFRPTDAPPPGSPEPWMHPYNLRPDQNVLYTKDLGLLGESRPAGSTWLIENSLIVVSRQPAATADCCLLVPDFTHDENKETAATALLNLIDLLPALHELSLASQAHATPVGDDGVDICLEPSPSMHERLRHHMLTDAGKLEIVMLPPEDRHVTTTPDRPMFSILPTPKK